MSNGHICCLYGVCCPPDKMAAQVAGHFGMPMEIASKVAGEIGVLVPRVLPGNSASTSLRKTCEDRLLALHDHNKQELTGILDMLGHPTA